MKKIFIVIFIVIAYISADCQNYYYVFFTDKDNVSFNPYEFFDQKAIERRLKNNLNLYDKTDFPVNQNYKMQVEALSEDFVGESRWFNMVMLSASDQNIVLIKNFKFVKDVVFVENNDAVLAEFDKNNETVSENADSEIKLSLQLLRMKGDYFDKNNITGKGVRIAVFDGGFPDVDKHEAFQHLRDNKRIIKTWNFPLKKEDVYGWNSHGTMVLSCITGIKTVKDCSQKTEEGVCKMYKSKLGLATDAEFLLARTEINSEPKKEEFWWLQAVEWADKNGAHIINSSLGYGIHRYNYKDMDGHTSLVSQAARLAARKGILVCNSAGNEGSDKNWRGIITPADVDSVLTVGGIIYSQQAFNHINFSSYGPTADGQMKPNVVAFGHAEVAKPNGNNKYGFVDGTSFSSPLTAGFAACALQTHPEWTGMQLKTELEKSANLYPYFDYALGYGIPQANYFTEKYKKEIKPTFEVTEDSSEFIIKLIDFEDCTEDYQYLFYNIQDKDGKLVYYDQINLSPLKNPETNEKIVKIKTVLKCEQSLNIYYNGFYQNYKSTLNKCYVGVNSVAPVITFVGEKKDYKINSVTVETQKPGKWGYNAKHFMVPYLGFSMFIPLNDYADCSDYDLKISKSFEVNLGLRYKYGVCKWYGLGLNYGFSFARFHLDSFDSIQKISKNFIPAEFPSNDNFVNKYNRLYTNSMELEFYQRFRLAVMSITDIHIDLGIYGSWLMTNNLRQKWTHGTQSVIQRTKTLEKIPLNYGVRLRFGYEIIEIYAQYRLSNIYNTIQDLPKLTVGLQIMIGK